MRALALALVIFFASSTGELVGDRIIIWNVGQGLWTTISTAEACTHIDMGGEKINWKKLVSLCGSKKFNMAAFTHWDLDHISFAEQASRRLSGFCISVPPRGPTNDDRTKMFSKFKLCPTESRTNPAQEFEVSEIKFPIQTASKKANDHSRVFQIHTTLFPGDSTAKQERIWSRIILPRNLKYLVLGHHGSKTSTSQRLLRALPNLRLAIASARKKRYGHPHRSVVENLDAHGVATLSTEQWNNIVIELR